MRPGANEPLRKLSQEWADKEKVDLTIEFITSSGDKLALTPAAEAQAGAGHDILRISDWQPGTYANQLEPVDDLVNSLIEEHGKVLLGTEYVGSRRATGSPCQAVTGRPRWCPAPGWT